MSEVVYERVASALQRLKLTRLAQCLDALAEEAATHKLTYLEFLDRLLEAEIVARSARDVAMKTKLAHFPFVKTLDQFDFAAQPSINERQVRELATMRFVAHGGNILLLGPPGVGKTHLAIGLGMAAIAHGMGVYFLSVADLVEMLQRDLKEDRLSVRLRALCKPKLLILDEMGYVPLDRCLRSPLRLRQASRNSIQRSDSLVHVISRSFLTAQCITLRRRAGGFRERLSVKPCPRPAR